MMLRFIKNIYHKVITFRYSFGKKKIHYIGNNVILPVNMTISGGGGKTLIFSTIHQ